MRALVLGAALVAALLALNVVLWRQLQQDLGKVWRARVAVASIERDLAYRLELLEDTRRFQERYASDKQNHWALCDRVGVCSDFLTSLERGQASQFKPSWMHVAGYRWPRPTSMAPARDGWSNLLDTTQDALALVFPSLSRDRYVAHLELPDVPHALVRVPSQTDGSADSTVCPFSTVSLFPPGDATPASHPIYLDGAFAGDLPMVSYPVSAGAHHVRIPTIPGLELVLVLPNGLSVELLAQGPGVGIGAIRPIECTDGFDVLSRYGYFWWPISSRAFDPPAG